MFIERQNNEAKEKYINLLKVIGALSRLSSDDKATPYLYYRMAENIFCKAFKADNLSRSDVSIDAKKDNIGFALKTFLHRNGKCLEKVAEFNKARDLFSKYERTPCNLIRSIADLRNKRILSTANIHGVDSDNMIYHCVTRSPGKFNIYETPISLINIECISKVKKCQNTISFEDGENEYSFNLAKSTLFKRFNIEPVLEIIEIKILDDPFEILNDLLEDELHTETIGRALQQVNIIGRVVLPLYSGRGKKDVPKRSGLNQWNARGRLRKANEVYIPIPSWIHRKFSGFFPPRDVSFNLHLPSGAVINSKVCQDGSKALMSNPNADLGKWLLRDILKLEEGKLVTYKMLKEIGVDSVEIVKNSETDFSINFKELDTYDEFEKANK